MAEGVSGALRVRAELIRDDEQDTGGSQRQKCLARCHDSHAHGAGGIIAATARNQHARDTEHVRCGGTDHSRRCRAFDQLGHLCAREIGGGKHLVGPLTSTYIEP